MITHCRPTCRSIFALLSCLLLGSSVLTEVVDSEHHKLLTDSSSAAEHRKFPWHRIRLPQTLFPVSYDITLQIDLTLFQVKGNVKIRVNCAKTTANIILHLKEMNVSNTAVFETKQDVEDMPAGVTEGVKQEEELITTNEERNRDQELQVTGTMQNKSLEMFLIEVKENLTPRRNYEIFMEFEYPLTDKLIGLYRSSYTTKSGDKR